MTMKSRLLGHRHRSARLWFRRPSGRAAREFQEERHRRDNRDRRAGCSANPRRAEAGGRAPPGRRRRV